VLSNPIPAESSVNLPKHRRSTVVAAARAGARDREDLEEFIARRGKPKAPSNPAKHVGGKKDGVPTVTIPRTEHALLIDIALVAQEFMPLLEMSGAPVKRPREWEMLSEGLEDFRRVRSGNNQVAAAKHAALGLMNIERLLADD
jgi:phosphoenolpyruvate carboxylase